MTINNGIEAFQGQVGALRAGNQRPADLEEACKQFEGLLLGMVLKDGLRDVFNDSSESGGGSMEGFKEYCIEQVATTLAADGSLGIADSLLAQFDGVAPRPGGML
jgi:Rod binding domain-containing protein